MNGLSDFIFQSKYARYDSKLGRKESFEESVERISNMHIQHLVDNYPETMGNISNDFYDAIEAYKNKIVFGSQRGLQFGGDPILNKHCRLFNCSATYVDRLDVFKEIEWVLLCGCGVGVSVEKQHIDKLPHMLSNLNTSVEDFVVEDSIEGWALAIDRLIKYYFIDIPYPIFDYSQIRPNGSLISGGFVAPGPKGLENAISKIDKVLKQVFKTTKKLSPLNATDIISYEADSVLSGGVRRSALIVLFDKDDKDMFNCKTGNWFYDNPQRARFNMSAVLDRNTTTKEEFEKVLQATKEFGEPGFVWRSNDKLLFNPCCLPSWTKVLTPEGLKDFGDLEIGDTIWSESGWTKVVNKISQGIKDVYEYRFSGGVFYGTQDHKIVSKGKKIEVQNAESIDSLRGKSVTKQSFDIQDIMDGLVIGDGYVHKASNDLVLLCIGKNDSDYHNSEIKPLINKHRPGISETAWEIKTTIVPEELPLKPYIKIPERFINGSVKTVLSFLRGLYSANGSVVDNRITLKTSSAQLRDDVQLMLSRVGIDSYYTTNKPTKVEFSNGEYECKESYDINITSDKETFIELIGFIQSYKLEKVKLSKKTNGRKNKKLIYSKFHSTEEVFDIEVDNETHTFWNNGLNVSNCEIGLYPLDQYGNSGWQFCNLISISGRSIKSAEDFYKACKYAATLGTLQASYQKFPFLGEITERIVANDPLIGVSIGGIMTNPEVLLDPEVLRKGAEIVLNQNKLIADKLGINPSSRCTAIKPDGNFSVLTDNSPGCHGEHAKHYIRRVQVNKEEEAGKIYKEINPKSVTESVWSNNGTDYCIMFPVTAKEGTITKSELIGVKQLEVVNNLQNNWVRPAMRKDNQFIKDGVENNVSNTVQVDNWDEVSDYVWDNKQHLAGISFIPLSGD